jgi:saccharopine dehydrogenase-like NADP-dependent oxidoreductase
MQPKKVLIVGAGGVGGVVAHKCAQVPEVFGEIVLASRTLSKCEAIRDQVKSRTGRDIEVAQVDADDVPQTVALLRKHKPDLLINVALPYQDLHLMDACLEAGVPYLDTANYEPPDEAKFEYKWQWAYRERFEKAGLMALLGSGFDPGVTNVFCAHAQKDLSTKFGPLTSSTAMRVATAILSPPISIPRSTFERSRSEDATGRKANGGRPIHSLCIRTSISRKLANSAPI